MPSAFYFDGFRLVVEVAEDTVSRKSVIYVICKGIDLENILGGLVIADELWRGFDYLGAGIQDYELAFLEEIVAERRTSDTVSGRGCNSR